MNKSYSTNYTLYPLILTFSLVFLTSCSNNTDKVNDIYSESKNLFFFDKNILENETDAEGVFYDYKDFRTNLINEELEELEKKEIDSISFLIEEQLGLFYSDLLLNKLDKILLELKESNEIQFDKLKKEKEITDVYNQYDTLNTILELESQTKILFKLGEIQSIVMLNEFEKWIKPLEGIKSNIDTFTNKIDSLITKF